GKIQAGESLIISLRPPRLRATYIVKHGLFGTLRVKRRDIKSVLSGTVLNSVVSDHADLQEPEYSLFLVLGGIIASASNHNILLTTNLPDLVQKTSHPIYLRIDAGIAVPMEEHCCVRITTRVPRLLFENRINFIVADRG